MRYTALMVIIICFTGSYGKPRKRFFKFFLNFDNPEETIRKQLIRELLFRTKTKTSNDSQTLEMEAMLCYFNSDEIFFNRRNQDTEVSNQNKTEYATDFFD